MSSSVIQMLVLAAIAIFLVMKLRSVLGTRDGFERPVAVPPPMRRRELEVIEGGPDRDITDYAEAGSPSAEALARMKAKEPDFSVRDFLQGARGAYEMILMAYERGDLSSVKAFLAPDVHEALSTAIADRRERGLTVDATFVGVSDVGLDGAEFDEATGEGEVSVRFTGELTRVVKDATGQVVEGSSTEIRRQRDVWTFARRMGSSDPNWMLVATGG